MQNIIIKTTVDITPTGVRRKTDDPDWFTQRNQQRNYDTLIQVISLRTQPMDIEIRILDIEDNAKTWLVVFSVDRQDVLGKSGELFLSDIDGVPIVPGLTETEPSFPPQFISTGRFKNIDITVVDNISK